MAHRRCVLVLLASLVSACPDEDEGDFSSKVVPVLERRCASAACHGVVRGTETDLSLDPSRWLTFTTDSTGRIVDHEAALESIRGKVSFDEDYRLSSFLRKTLPVTMGGVHHFGGAVFSSTDNPEYRTLARFAASLGGGTEGRDEPELSALEQKFREQVYPFLVNRGCATATCHGELNFGVSIFRAPVDATEMIVSRRDVRDAYRNARANITLWGDPLQSRLVAKPLSFEHGGIAHKGGNDTAFAVEQGLDPRDSEAMRDILDWIADERAAELGDAPMGASALVAVGGPLARSGAFDPPPFVPGTDLYRIDAPFAGETPVNLTAEIHDAPVDIRDPAISHDGTRVVFTMRTSAADAHNVYVMNLDGTGLVQLTEDRSEGPGGRTIANMSPLFGPNGGFGGESGPSERIYWVSMRGDLSDDGRTQNSDLYVMNVDGSNVEQLTYTCQPEVRPAFLTSGEFAGALAYTIKRAAVGGYKGVLFRFPVDHNAAFHFQPEAHPHFGMSEPQQVFTGLREMADGRNLVTLEDEGNLTHGGQLAILERQFAVEIPVGEEDQATLPGFRHALTVLDDTVALTGASDGGLFRDPLPLPDGSIVVARADGPVDLDDPPADLTTRLVRIVTTTNRATFRPEVVSMDDLTDGDMPLSQPAAVLVRGTEDPPHPRAWNDADATGNVVHSGVQVIEAVLARMAPTGPRTLRTDIAFVRPVVPITTLAAVLGRSLDVVPVPADETRDGHPHATNLSLTGHLPLFAAAEAPPAADGSLAVQVPAKVPVRVTTLDANRMVIGAQQPQWYAVLPGERFPVGIPASAFSARCSGCHGAMDGEPTSALQPPVDTVTQASVTMSMYHEADRRRPIDPLPAVTPELFIQVDFRVDVQPILEAKCVSCHAGADPDGGLSLSSDETEHYTDAYESLLRPGDGSARGFEYVDAAGGSSRRSFLVEKLRDEELDAARAVEGPCPPEGSDPLTPTELETLVRWIELGAAFIGRP